MAKTSLNSLLSLHAASSAVFRLTFDNPGGQPFWLEWTECILLTRSPNVNTINLFVQISPELQKFVWIMLLISAIFSFSKGLLDQVGFILPGIWKHILIPFQRQECKRQEFPESSGSSIEICEVSFVTKALFKHMCKGQRWYFRQS